MRDVSRPAVQPHASAAQPLTSAARHGPRPTHHGSEATVPDGYDKDVTGVMLDYMPSDIGDYAGTDFDLRITFGDDPLDTAFWVTVPGKAEGLTLRELIQQYLMGQSREDREQIGRAA